MDSPGVEKTREWVARPLSSNRGCAIGLASGGGVPTSGIGPDQDPLLRRNARIKGKWRDDAVYGVLRREWAARRKGKRR